MKHRPNQTAESKQSGRERRKEESEQGIFHIPYGRTRPEALLFHVIAGSEGFVGKGRRNRYRKASESSPNSKPIKKPGVSIFTYFRSIGLAAILVGLFGVMQTAFLMSVCGVFAGLALFAADVWLENFRREWHRWLLLAALITVTVAFGTEYAFKSAPLRFGAVRADPNPAANLVLVTVSNNSDEDYHNLELSLRPQPRTVLVTKAFQYSSLPGVTIYPALPATLSDGDVVQSGYPLSQDSHDMISMLGNFLNVRCEMLPRRSFIVFEVKFDRHFDSKIDIQATFDSFLRERKSRRMVDVIGL